jgi:hypothetical protein
LLRFLAAPQQKISASLGPVKPECIKFDLQERKKEKRKRPEIPDLPGFLFNLFHLA